MDNLPSLLVSPGRFFEEEELTYKMAGIIVFISLFLVFTSGLATLSKIRVLQVNVTSNIILQATQQIRNRIVFTPLVVVSTNILALSAVGWLVSAVFGGYGSIAQHLKAICYSFTVQIPYYLSLLIYNLLHPVVNIPAKPNVSILLSEVFKAYIESDPFIHARPLLMVVFTLWQAYIVFAVCKSIHKLGTVKSLSSTVVSFLFSSMLSRIAANLLL